MSRQFDEAMALAKRLAKRTKQPVAILQDDDGQYLVVAELDYLDDPRIVQRVPRAWMMGHTYGVGDSAAGGRDEIDQMIDDLNAIFGHLQPYGVVH